MSLRNAIAIPDRIKPGERFTRWVVCGYSHKEHSRHYFRCACDCGEIRTVQWSNLRDGLTKSCGCLARELMSARLTKPDDASITAKIKRGYLTSARQRGLPWNLSDELFAALIRSPCHYCGEKAGNLTKTRTATEAFAYNGVDRVNNSLGYDPDNVVPCCGHCNRAKLTLALPDFINWARRIAAIHGEASK